MFEFNDLGGQDYNIVINKIILKSITAIIYCCSPELKDSLENILKWNKACLDTIESTENVPKFIVINKCDLVQKFEEKDIEKVKNKIAKKYYYVSAKDGVFKNEDSKTLKVNQFLDDLLDNIDNLENIKEVLSESDVDLGLDLERKRSESEYSQNNKQKEEGDNSKKGCCQ
jgi:signal recognition particle receptor subunit beta